MQVKSIAYLLQESILQYFWPSLSFKLPFVFKTFVLPILSGCLRQVYCIKKWVWTGNAKSNNKLHRKGRDTEH